MTNIKLCEHCDFLDTDICLVCRDNEYYDDIDISHITENEIEEVQETKENGTTLQQV